MPTFLKDFIDVLQIFIKNDHQEYQFCVMYFVSFVGYLYTSD